MEQLAAAVSHAGGSRRGLRRTYGSFRAPGGVEGVNHLIFSLTSCFFCPVAEKSR
jgi:hypothetical protein